MAFTEDLSLFFDTTNGFAVAAIIKTSAGVTVRTINGIVTSPLEDLPVFDAQVEVSGPDLICRTADLGGVTHSHKVEISAVLYRIVKRNDDGTGISTLQLKV